MCDILQKIKFNLAKSRKKWAVKQICWADICLDSVDVLYELHCSIWLSAISFQCFQPLEQIWAFKIATRVEE